MRRDPSLAVEARGQITTSFRRELSMAAVKKGNRTKRTVKNRAKVKQVAAKRKRVRHQKSVKKGMRAR
jgi:hypothetical protein